MKFLQTIQFDPSDSHVFEHVAIPGEWAVTGGFCFAGVQENDLKGKAKQAFSNGFFSLGTFGFSTFTSVVEITPETISDLTQSLATRFVEAHGAPDLDVALGVAQEELSFVLDMCKDVPINTVFALSRYFDDAGEIREELRIVDAPQEAVHTKVWEIVE